ncbi:MAG: SMC family ATPase, partial [Candidatus Aenigmatarchaeota archaeon]
MMELKSIKLQNIRSYIDETLEFPNGSLLLAGDIGCGKSSILLAVEFALFGIQRGELTGSDILRHGSKNGMIELHMNIDGKDVVIQRNVKREKKGISQDAGFIEIDGKREEKTASELRAMIIDLLGYPQEYQTKNPLMFRYTVYTPQDSMKQILIADPEERLRILRKIFDVDKYGIIRNNASGIVMRELRSMKKLYETQTADIEQKRNDVFKRNEDVLKNQNDLFDKKNSLDKIDDEIKIGEQSLEQVSKDLKKMSIDMQESTRLSTLIEQKKKRIDSIAKEIRDNEKRIDELGKLLINKPIA